MSQPAANKILTLPNLITLIRLLLVPVFVVCLLVYENNVAAFFLFLLAACTDFVDGTIARSTGQVSKLGQLLDPLVDRVLIIAAVVSVYILGRVPLWIPVLLLLRDAVLLLLTLYIRFGQHQEFKVIWLGKTATAVNMAGFCMLIINWPELAGLGLL